MSSFLDNKDQSLATIPSNKLCNHCSVMNTVLPPFTYFFSLPSRYTNISNACLHFIYMPKLLIRGAVRITQESFCNECATEYGWMRELAGIER